METPRFLFQESRRQTLGDALLLNRLGYSIGDADFFAKFITFYESPFQLSQNKVRFSYRTISVPVSPFRNA